VTQVKKLLSALVLTAFLISVFVTGFPQVSEAAALYAEDFETIEALENWTSEDGVLEITDERRKFNQSSLKWSYTSGGTLRGKCEEFGNFNDYSVNQGIELEDVLKELDKRSEKTGNLKTFHQVDKNT